MNDKTVKKGIILAGGFGTRLWPITVPISKQLLPVYDKPMIYYPLTTLMFAGIKEILIITTASDQSRFKSILDDGSQWGIKILYEIQQHPNGIAEAFSLGAKFIDNSPCALILGDNIFHGAGFSEILFKAAQLSTGAATFSYNVNDPENYGVVKFDDNNTPILLKEKPQKYISSWAMTGLYFYDEKVVEIARSVTASKRGEYEITSINQVYLDRKELTVNKIGRGSAWFDAGTHASLLGASQYIHAIESRQGLKIGCPEEVAYRMKYIDLSQFKEIIGKCKRSDYADYLQNIILA